MSTYDAQGNLVEKPDTYKPTKPKSFSSKDLNQYTREEILELIKSRGKSMFYKWKVEEKKLIRGAFKPPIMSTVCQKLYHPKSLVDEKGISDTWFYDWDKHIYRNGAKDYLGVKIKDIFNDDFKKSYVDQTYSDVKYSTPLLRNLFKVVPEYIPQKNDILQIFLNGKNWRFKHIKNTPELYVTSRWDVEYDPNAKNPQWDKFLDDIFYSKDLPFLQEYCGAILYFKAVRKALILAGPTNSGKTTFGFVLSNILGGENSGNVRAIPPQRLEDKYECYRTYKLPLILVNEFPRAKLEDCSILKAIITGAQISGRTLNCPSIEFIPFVKIIALTNDLPNVAEDGEQWWNKWQIVTVDKQKFDDDNDDKRDHFELFLTHTQEQRNAIFTWMVDGLIRYMNSGGRFTNIDSWEETRKKWKSHADSLGQFITIENGWVKYYDTAEVSKQDFFDHYVLYCKSSGAGVTPMSKTKFFREMKKRYIDSDNPIIRETKPMINNKQVACYGGIACAEIENEPPEWE